MSCIVKDDGKTECHAPGGNERIKTLGLKNINPDLKPLGLTNLNPNPPIKTTSIVEPIKESKNYNWLPLFIIGAVIYILFKKKKH